MHLSYEFRTRKIAEIELNHSKAELDRIFNLSPDFVGYGNLDGVFTKVNKALYSILGYKEEEFLKQPFMNFIHPDDLATTGAELQKAQEGMTNIAIDNRYRCKDGVYKWIAWSVVSDLSKNEFLAVGRDISDRKEAELALKDREKTLEKQIELRTCELEEKVRELGFQKLALDEHSIVSVTDVNGKITYVNQKFCEVSGFSEQELIGQNHRVLSSGEHPEEFYTNIWETIANGKVWQGVIKNLKKNGGYYWSEVTITPFLNDKGKPFQYVAIRTDVTERHNSEIRYRELCENMSDGVAVYGAIDDGEDFKFVGYNRAAEILTKVSRNDTLGKSVTDVFPGVESLGLLEVFKRVWRTGKPEKYPSNEYQDGRISFWVENYVFKLPSDEIVAIFHDLSELKKNEQALIDSRNEAEEANKSKSKFLSQMSHELRTPLNAILGFGQLFELDKQALSKNQQENIKEILLAGHHLLNLINEVLDLAKIEAGKLDIHLEDVSVANLIKQCLTLVAPQAEMHDVTLMDYVSSEGSMVRADATRLKQVLLNFLSNAVKYNRKQGRVRINSEIINSHRIRISVADTGKGLLDADIEKLYTPFERLNAENNIEGTGIGLVISKRLIELMDGAMGVDSILGEGSTFWVELELCPGL